MSEFNSTPMRHQLAAVAACVARPRNPCPADAFAYLAETGTGKSLMPLIEWQRAVVDGSLNRLMVVAPAGSIKNWYRDKTADQPSELRRHLRPDIFKSTVVGYHEAGKSASKKSVQTALASTGPAALFVNVEALSRPGQLLSDCIKFLRGGRGMIVVDESTVIMRESGRTKNLLLIAPHAKARRILTGLVSPRDPLDAFWQFYFLDWRILGQRTFVGFRARYARVEESCYMRNDEIDRLAIKLGAPADKVDDVDRAYKIEWLKRRIPERMWQRRLKLIPRVAEFQNLGELKEKISAYSFQVLKKDCLDLPEKIYMPPRVVEMTDEQHRVYRELRSQLLSELSGARVQAKTVLSAMIKLQQVACGHVRDVDGRVHLLPTRRVDAVLELLREHEGKAIVWSCYDPEVRRIVRAIDDEFGEGCAAAYWGGNVSQRDAEERRFLEEESCRVMVSTQMSGGRGNTWNQGTLVIYAANSYSLEHRFQSEDRSHRKGQVNRVTYVDLICVDTVEEKILQVLRRKLDLLSQITPREYRRWVI